MKIQNFRGKNGNVLLNIRANVVQATFNKFSSLVRCFSEFLMGK